MDFKKQGGQVGRATCDVTAVRTGAVRQPNGQTGATEVKRETKKKIQRFLCTSTLPQNTTPCLDKAL